MVALIPHLIFSESSMFFKSGNSDDWSSSNDKCYRNVQYLSIKEPITGKEYKERTGLQEVLLWTKVISKRFNTYSNLTAIVATIGVKGAQKSPASVIIPEIPMCCRETARSIKWERKHRNKLLRAEKRKEKRNSTAEARGLLSTKTQTPIFQQPLRMRLR